ncbi:cytochrome P450 76C1-like protein [Tanacetum coccineum]
MGVMKKVQDELTEVIGMKLVEESDRPKLTYLDAVVKETFRLHPPLPLLMQRCPDEDCIMTGYTIPKGTIVYMNVWAVHRDPKNWPNPLEFSPERFLNSKWDYTGSKFQFLPFWSGRRICPGILLGEKMLMYILASLLHSFEWHLPKDKELELSDVFGIIKRLRRQETPRIVGDDSARSEPTEVADSNNFKPLLKEKRLKEQTEKRQRCRTFVEGSVGTRPQRKNGKLLTLVKG